MDAIGQLLSCMRTTEYSVFRNAQIKRYPNGSAVVTVFDRNIIRAPGFEAVGVQTPPELSEEAAEASGTPEDEKRKEAANLARSKRRAKAAVYDIAMATDFSIFATFTVSPDKVGDRMDDAEVFRHLQDWLDNNVRRHGLAYVLVPEYHKRGGLHFHALINDALPMKNSGTLVFPGGRPRLCLNPKRAHELIARGAQVVYNIPGWSFGFSTGIKLYGERAAAINYVTKYITKSEKKIGGRWYYSGGELKRPQVETCWLDFGEASWLGECFEITELGAKGVRLELDKEDVYETLEKLRGTARPVRDRDREEMG